MDKKKFLPATNENTDVLESEVTSSGLLRLTHLSRSEQRVHRGLDVVRALE